MFEDGIPPVEQEWFSARDGSQRKGSAPAELETDKKRASCDPSKVNKVKLSVNEFVFAVHIKWGVQV